MPKPTVYLDTSFISAYWFDGRDETIIQRRVRSQEWWSIERKHFRCSTSRFTELELRTGVFPWQNKAVMMCRRLPYCSVTKAAKRLWTDLLANDIIPKTKHVDGWQLALAIHHRFDYLLSWNFSHLANPDVQNRLDQFCHRRKLEVPWLVTPNSIPQVQFGQDVRWRFQ